MKNNHKPLSYNESGVDIEAAPHQEADAKEEYPLCAEIDEEIVGLVRSQTQVSMAAHGLLVTVE